MKHPWWAADLRAMLSIALGLAVLYWPRIDVETLVLLCGTFAIADGVMIALIGVRLRSRSMLLAGSLGLLAGIWVVSRPELSEEVILFAIGVWAAIRGAFDIYTSIRLRREMYEEWLLMSKGVLLLVFGVVMSTSFTVIAAMFPQLRAIVLDWMIAVFALIEGGLLLAFAERLRRMVTRAELHASTA